MDGKISVILMKKIKYNFYNKMFYYKLSDICQGKFDKYDFLLRKSRLTLEKKIKIKTDNKKNNFKETLDILPTLLPEIYDKVSHKEKEQDEYLMNNNRGSFLVWYIDGSDNFTLKHKLNYNSKYVITEKDYEKEDLFISKPSHEYIGSGKYIKIGKYKDLINREKIKIKNEFLDFIIQPLISKNLRLWEYNRKFDIRLYAAIYTSGNDFEYYSHPYGVARLALHTYDPFRDYSSVITNISIQESLPGYTTDDTLKLIKDDTNIGNKILKDLNKRDLLQHDYTKENQLLILGLDILILNDGSFRLIEINKDPYIMGKENPYNMENVACLTFIMKIFGNLIPKMKI